MNFGVDVLKCCVFLWCVWLSWDFHSGMEFSSNKVNRCGLLEEAGQGECYLNFRFYNHGCYRFKKQLEKEPIIILKSLPA